MRILLDTHAFIRAVTDSRRLGKEARQVMRDATKVFVSAASIWEIAIKSVIGKIKADPERESPIAVPPAPTLVMQLCQSTAAAR